MSQDTPQRITENISTITDGTQEMISQNGSHGVLPDNDASQAIVQCLLIAARRGRQIRLAREQAARLQQSEFLSVSDERTQP